MISLSRKETHCQWKSQVVQPFQKAYFSKAFDPVTSLPAIYPKEIEMHTNIYAQKIHHSVNYSNKKEWQKKYKALIKYYIMEYSADMKSWYWRINKWKNA